MLAVESILAKVLTKIITFKFRIMLLYCKLYCYQQHIIQNSKLSYCISSKELHTISKLDPLNVRINFLANKTFNKIHETYSPSNGLYPDHFNLFSDYEIIDPPLKRRKCSVASRIIKRIYSQKSLCPWFDPPSLDLYPKIPAVYRWHIMFRSVCLFLCFWYVCFWYVRGRLERGQCPLQVWYRKRN